MEINDFEGKLKVIAYYLPQYYPNAFNDKWFGKGFTEWTNVGKAKPLFEGHYQPKVPANLGYYDLRVPEVANEQAVLAKKSGVAGFAYWHYWFGNGNKLLEMPAERMLETGNPDFPFCFAWANESWKQKQWDMKKKDIITMEQLYPGEKDNKDHFDYCLPFFKDKRYIRFDNRPIFCIYRPMNFDNLSEFISQWNMLIKEAGVADSFYFIAIVANSNHYQYLKDIGFDCITYEVLSKLQRNLVANRSLLAILKRRFMQHVILKMNSHAVKKMYYKDVLNAIWEDGFDDKEDVAPVLIPNYDHSPRSGNKNYMIVDPTPENWEKEVKYISGKVLSKENKLVFLRAWNEWGEGNYMEPDLKYGEAFINVLSKYVYR